ncbi:AbrB/MazE/SpoVT family DNA-binding domain-containing protein [Candidatus Woesearchaeota archaeon]|nr:AbrB/MazE/SpoVT family DNA-binding domain-containing protein [Candidatus Woesearchaeota archaeon]
MVGIQLQATIGEKGQIVIPKPIRDKFHLRPFTMLVFDVEEERIILKKREEGLAALERYASALKKKKPAPQKIDWNKLYYSQYEE